MDAPDSTYRASRGEPKRRARTSATRDNLVLIIDDDLDTRCALVETLEDEGYCAMSAANGLEALELLRVLPSPPTVIVLDLMMPVMDGWEFRAEQQRDPLLAKIPVIAVSAHGNMLEPVCQISASAHLKKPLLMKELLMTVGKFFQGPPVSLESSSLPAYPQKRPPLRVLIAEDDPITQLVVRTLLERQGYVTVLAHDGLEAIARYQTEHFDLVLTDIQMPQMDGVALTASIRRLEAATGAHVPIIAISSLVKKESDRERCRAAGMDGFVSKPILPRVLIAEVEKLLGASARKMWRTERKLP